MPRTLPPTPASSPGNFTYVIIFRTPFLLQGKNSGSAHVHCSSSIYIYTSVTRNRTPSNQCKQLANIVELAESSSVSGHSKFGLIKIALKE